MKRWFAPLTLLGCWWHPVLAHAQDETPVVIEYVAPPECASTQAFHLLVTAQLARVPNPGRPWRFSVSIVHADDAYIGRLSTEGGTRMLHGGTCDEVAAALSLLIAMAAPELTRAPEAAPPPPPPAPPPPPPPPAPPPVNPPLLLQPPSFTERPHDAVEARTTSTTAWRLGLRFQDWSKQNAYTTNGVSLAGSLEPTWGHYHMLAEVSLGVFITPVSDPSAAINPQNAVTGTWAVLETQVCPLDIPLGSTGLSILGCGRMGAALTQFSNYRYISPLMGWVGGGGRLRWQSPWRFYAEVHVSGVEVTQSAAWPEAEMGWLDVGATVGVRL